jgi:predicted ArsR family transcriptional regulator
MHRHRLAGIRAVAEPSSEERAVDQFILDKIDSEPHLEALLLLWNSRPAEWSAEELAKRLYVDRSLARKLLEDLTREEIVVGVPGSIGQFRYETRSEGRDKLIELLDMTYRKQLVRISTIIHSKASSAVRDFARAFRFTKEKE